MNTVALDIRASDTIRQWENADRERIYDKRETPRRDQPVFATPSVVYSYPRWIESTDKRGSLRCRWCWWCW